MKIGIKQRHVDVLTSAGSFAMEQGAGDRAHCMGPGADITDRYHRHVGRSVLFTNQGGDSSVGLTNEIKARIVGERAGLAECRDRAHYDFGINSFEYLIAQPHLNDDARREILDHNVNLRHQLFDQLDALPTAQIDTKAFLAAVSAG